MAKTASSNSAAFRYIRGDSGSMCIDTHLHLSCSESVDYAHGVQPWLDGIGKCAGREESPFRGDFSEKDFKDAVCLSGNGINIESCIFVEVCPSRKGSKLEASWVLKMVENSESKVDGLVANIPVTDGAKAVKMWLRDLNELVSCSDSDHLKSNEKNNARKQHYGLKGARQVMLGDKGSENDCTRINTNSFIEGLTELGAHNLHFEFCVRAQSLCDVYDCIKKCPHTNFILDHCGLNNSGKDFAKWKEDITLLASCKNLVACKLSAIEEWDVVNENPIPYVEFALITFGVERCVFGGNWFVPIEHNNSPYSKTPTIIAEALTKICADEEQVRAVFQENAKRVYRLNKP